jgi:hypothetical protein
MLKNVNTQNCNQPTKSAVSRAMARICHENQLTGPFQEDYNEAKERLFEKNRLRDSPPPVRGKICN